MNRAEVFSQCIEIISHKTEAGVQKVRDPECCYLLHKQSFIYYKTYTSHQIHEKAAQCMRLPPGGCKRRKMYASLTPSIEAVSMI